jgi:hypothetical protein
LRTTNSVRLLDSQPSPARVTANVLEVAGAGGRMR